MPNATTCTPARASTAIPPALVPLTDLERLHTAGVHYAETVDAWRWLYRVHHERSMVRAFPRVGRRILVDIPACLDAVRAHAAP